MELDHLFGCHLLERAYIQQVRAMLSAVGDRDFHLPRRGQSNVFEPAEILLQDFFDSVVL